MRNKRLNSKQILPMINAYYKLPGVGLGGSLHIVLEDPNYQNHHVQWCINHAIEVGDIEGQILGELMLTMSKRQREKCGWELTYPWSADFISPEDAKLEFWNAWADLIQ